VADYSRHHHHHRYRQVGVSSGPSRLNWRRDKKIIIGFSLLIVTSVVLVLGPFRPFFKELVMLCKEMVTPEPENTLDADPLKINYKYQKERQATGDSVAAAQHLDTTMRREIRRQTVPVYRPPRKHNEWYLTEKDVKDLRRGQDSKSEE